MSSDTNTQPTYSSQAQQFRLAAPVPVNTSASQQLSAPQQAPFTLQAVESQQDGQALPKRVYKIRHHFEKNMETVNESQPPPLIPAQEVNTMVSGNRQAIHDRSASPPPPPVQFADVPRMAPVPPPPPPPPPAPEPDASLYDKDKGTFTFRDRKGRARTVRIGRVVWPPPVEGGERKQREVGKLEIDEKVQKELDERMRPVVKKVETPREPKKVVVIPPAK